MFKSLLYYRYKTILILVSAISAITSIFLITAISNGIVDMYSDMLKTDGDIIVTQKGVADTFFSDVDRGLIESIQKIDGVKSAQGVIVGAGSIGIVPIAGIYGVTDNRMQVYKLTSGTYPKKDSEILLGKNIDTLLKTPKTVKVFGLDFEVSGVYESEIGFENGGVVIGIEKASDMFKKSASFLLVTMADISGDSSSIINNILSLSDNIESKSTADFIDNYNQFKIIKVSGGVIASISFFMGLLAIVSIMSIMINDRKYEFGIKRAVGISKYKITAEVVTEVLFLTFISFVVSLVLSMFILEFLQSVDKFQGYLSGEIDFTLAIIILLSSLVMSAVGALIPAALASRVDPIVLINQGQ